MSWAPLLLSLRIAAMATLVSVVCGVALAMLLTWRKLPARHLLDAVVSAPMVLPPTVLGYYLLVSLGVNSAVGQMWERLFGTSIVFTLTGAVIAATVGSLPLVVRASRTGLEHVDPTLVLAAHTLGAGKLRTFFTVVLPLAAPGIIGGAMLGFARALGDFGITIMVAGSRIGDTQPASIFIYDAIQANREADANRMAVVMTVVGVGILYAVNRLSRGPHD
ncbi:MAG TPA: molybdate ABC transporter permease subunit [Kofleriaceae bacterium]|nr:molybdate ABC transporter permease subunit [Kofleriaceae bacterium]